MAVSLADLVTNVTALTKRNGIDGITKHAIRTAIRQAHSLDFFRGDLSTGSLSYTASTTPTYDIANFTASLPRCRALDTVMGYDVTNTPVESFEYRDTDDLYDSDNIRRPSVYTVIGSTMRIAPLKPTGIIKVTFFQLPDLSDDNFASWIVEKYQYEIEAWAAQIVHARVGNESISNSMLTQSVQPFKAELVANELLAYAR